MAELYQTSIPNINIHIQNICNEGELRLKATVKEFLTVQKEGSRTVKRSQDFYNLDMILFVGCRIKSHTATRFRQWATVRLREYIVKGFLLDDERLKKTLAYCYIFYCIRQNDEYDKKYDKKNLYVRANGNPVFCMDSTGKKEACPDQ